MKNLHILRLIVCTLLLPTTMIGFAQNAMQTELNKYCSDDKNFFYTNVAVSVRDIDSHKLIAEYNGNRSMTPASIVKVYTSAAALSYLGDDFQFKTTLAYTGDIDKNGTLLGDIVLVGGGDPTMGSKFFPATKSFIDTIVVAVQNAGIKRIKGSVIIDCSLYKDEREAIPGSWLFDDFGKDYAAGVFPVSFKDNIFQFSIKTGEVGDTIKVTNETDSAFTMSGTIGDSTLMLHSATSDQLVKVSGYLPPNRNDYVVRSAMPSPPDVLGMELHQAFFRKGIVPPTHKYEISKKKISQTTLLKEIYSPKLRYIVGIMNYYSSNNYAEHILRYLGYKEKGTGTFSDGALTVMQYFKTLEMESSGAALYDGSGLSRTDVINANHMSEFLSREYVAVGGTTSSFYQSLPTSGRTGTLRSYPFTSKLVDKVHAKTGSMSGVRNLAGYMETKSGKIVSFCIMFNGFFEKDYKMKEKHVKILEAIYENY